MIVPSGSPIWTRTASMQDYGGHVDKIDYGNIGAVNARTDVTAAQICRLAEDSASMAYMVPLFWMEVVRTSGGFNVQSFRALWRPVIVGYDGADPLTVPAYADCVTALLSGSNLLLRLPNEATDRFGVTAAINPRAVFCDSQPLVSLVYAGYYFAEFLWSGAAGTSAIIRCY